MADITKVTLAKEKDSGTEYYYPSSSSDIIDHQIKDTNVHVSVKKKLDDLEDLVGSINTDIDVQEVIDARTARSDNLVKNNLKIRIDKDYDVLNNKINSIRKVAIVGGSESFSDPTHSLFKIADGTLNADNYIVLTFAISSIKYNGILVLYAVNTDDEISVNIQVTCGNFDNNGNDINFKASTLGNEWILYYDTGLEYDSRYKVLFEVISEYGTNTKNANYTLYSNLEVTEYLDNITTAELIQFPYGRKKGSAIGSRSITAGKDNIASGRYGTAIGENNNNNQNYSLAFGISNTIEAATSYYNDMEQDIGGALALGHGNRISTNTTIAMGVDNKANGEYSTIIGTGNEIDNGYRNITIGYDNQIYRVPGNSDSTCDDSFVIGAHNQVTGYSSMVIGNSNQFGSDGSYVYNTLNGNHTHLIGADNRIISNYSMIIGDNNYSATALNYAYIFGSNNYLINESDPDNTRIATMFYPFAIGFSNIVHSTSLVIGSHNKANGAASICIGHGITYEGYPAGIKYLSSPSTQNESSGRMSMVIGYNSKASGEESITIGHNNTSSGRMSLAIGRGLSAETMQSINIGYYNYNKSPESPSAYIDGSNSIAIGFGNWNAASASTSIGVSNHNYATGAITMGVNNVNSSIGSFVCGIGGSNKELRTSTLDNTQGDVLVIGNGCFRENYIDTIISTDQETQSNAFRISNSGGAYLNTGTYNSIGADYAEFIKEWYDGNPDNEDRVGYMVTIGEDGKLHKANEGDYIIGITSGNPSIVGNADEEYYWRYERDRFNRVIIEEAEIKIPKLDSDGNPITNMDDEPIMETIKVNQRKQSSDYDASKEYIERAKRPEWDYVGMRGIVPCRDDGTCVTRGFCKCGQNGIATKAETRGFDTYYVIERIDEETISVEVR